MRLAIYSRKLFRTKNLAAFFPEYELVKRTSKKVAAFAGWGLKKYSKTPRNLAAKKGLPYIALEDGFIRSYDLGVSGTPPLSIVVDDLGVYYDAGSPSRLEKLIEQDFSAEKLERAKRNIELIKKYQLSKYNVFSNAKFSPAAKAVLVIDQCFGDASIKYGMADSSSFDCMISDAIAENPDSEIIVKVHPDVIVGKRKGYIDLKKYRNKITILSENINPHLIFKNVQKVYVVTSLLGFEALFYNLTVKCYGMPFYAGWGLTEDKIKCERRTKKAQLEEVFYASYIDYARYVNPYTAKCCEVEEAIDVIAFLKSYYAKHNADYLCFGFSKWKQTFLKYYIKSPQNQVDFTKYQKHLSATKNDVLVWAAKEPLDLATKVKTKIIRVEDGFIRSCGLGSDLVPASSLSIDFTGIHFDYSKPSDLENYLNYHEFDDTIKQRATKLIEVITSRSVTKYNTEKSEFKYDLPQGKKIILAVGQVEGDASIRLGSPKIKTNLELITAIRNDNPDTFIIYKPHPDVVSGNREGKVDKGAADLLVNDINIHQLIKRVDEVHTITSLVGFEALLQRKKVVVYGLPFYSNWGLTEDKIKLERRERKLELEELAAAALILYPSYFDYESDLPCQVEVVIERVSNSQPQKIKSHFWLKVKNLVKLAINLCLSPFYYFRGQ